MKTSQKQLLIAGVLILGASLATYYFICKDGEKNSNAAGRGVISTASTTKGGYVCMDGNRQCAWQQSGSGNYFCPCSLIKTTASGNML